MWDTGEDQTKVKFLIHTELKSLLTKNDREVAARPGEEALLCIASRLKMSLV